MSATRLRLLLIVAAAVLVSNCTYYTVYETDRQGKVLRTHFNYRYSVMEIQSLQEQAARVGDFSRCEMNGKALRRVYTDAAVTPRSSDFQMACMIASMGLLLPAESEWSPEALYNVNSALVEITAATAMVPQTAFSAAVGDFLRTGPDIPWYYYQFLGLYASAIGEILKGRGPELSAIRNRFLEMALRDRERSFSEAEEWAHRTGADRLLDPKLYIGVVK
jgi:hypothetical protein